MTYSSEFPSRTRVRILTSLPGNPNGPVRGENIKVQLVMPDGTVYNIPAVLSLKFECKGPRHKTIAKLALADVEIEVEQPVNEEVRDQLLSHIAAGHLMSLSAQESE